MKYKTFLIIGSIMLTIIGGITIAGSFSGSIPIFQLLCYGLVLFISGVLGFIGLASKSKKIGVFYIVMGIISIIPAILICLKIVDRGGSSVAFVAIGLPIFIATVLWIVGGRECIK